MAESGPRTRVMDVTKPRGAGPLPTPGPPGDRETRDWQAMVRDEGRLGPQGLATLRVDCSTGGIHFARNQGPRDLRLGLRRHRPGNHEGVSKIRDHHLARFLLDLQSHGLVKTVYRT